MSNVSVKLFSETIGGFDVDFFTEGSGKKKVSGFEGIMAQMNMVNGNGRIYPDEVLVPAVENYVKQRVERNIAMGELDHPETLTVSARNASHLITDLRIEGDNVIGKAKFLTNSVGMDAKALYESGVALTVSTRGGGRAHKKKGIQYMDLFVLTAIDLVSLPSAPDAFVNGVMENLEFYVESGQLSKSMASKTSRMNTMSNDEFARHMESLINAIQLPTL